MKQYRNEWKYCCAEAALQQAESRLRAVLPLDAHTEASGRYELHSLYFDDAQNTCAHETEAGLPQRFKYRIRYYGPSPHALQLERKEKLQSRCHKAACPLTLAQYRLILAGEYTALLRTCEEPLLQRFGADCLARGFRPALIVDYERTAFVEENWNVRITVDRNISASRAVEHFLTGDYQRYPVQAHGQHILEVKFDEILPSYIRHAAYLEQMQQTAFSKYYLGCQIVRRNTV
jgi:hypothetical protein